MPSAPEHAREVMRLAQRLEPEGRDRLAYRWIDRSVRVYTAQALERMKRPELADELRGIGEIINYEGCLHTKDVLIRIFGASGPVGKMSQDLLACVSGVLATIRSSVFRDGSPDLYQIAVGTLTSARCVGVRDEEQCQLEEIRAAAGI